MSHLHKSDHEHVSLRSLLEYYRQQAKSPSELGTLFENLVMAYLMHDPLHFGRYETVESYYEWAKEREGWNKMISALIWLQSFAIKRDMLLFNVSFIKQTIRSVKKILIALSRHLGKTSLNIVFSLIARKWN
ncbi:hypothetical protein GGR09_001670 [Bartonella heixiaziensis]